MDNISLSEIEIDEWYDNTAAEDFILIKHLLWKFIYIQ